MTINRMNDLIPSVKISGEVSYGGTDIFDKSVDVNELRRQVGMVFQKPNPFPMRIFDVNDKVIGENFLVVDRSLKMNKSVKYALAG